MASLHNGPDGFEQRIKDSLEHFEVPYNSADWAQLERSLNGNRMRVLPRAGLIAGLILGGMAMGGATWYLLQDRNDTLAGTAGHGGTTPTLEVPAVDPATTAPTATERGPVHPTTDERHTVTTNDHEATPESAGTTRPRSSQAPGAGTEAGKGSTARATEEAPKPVASTATAAKPVLLSATTDACSGNTVTFKVDNMPENGIYLWNFGDGSFSNKPTPEHVFSKPGRYQVMLSMSAPGVGTIHNKPTSQVITIHEVPKAAFQVSERTFDGHLPSHRFENQSMGAVRHHWSFGDGTSSDLANPAHMYRKKGVYQAELTVVNSNGCEDKVVREVRVDKDLSLGAPAAFTPNGDGLEDGFIPAALRDLTSKFSLSIYDTQGHLLYQTSDATKPWLGKPHNRGETCAAGEYVWVTDIVTDPRTTETFTGKVRLRN